jgi:hypothetical protein
MGRYEDRLWSEDSAKFAEAQTETDADAARECGNRARRIGNYQSTVATGRGNKLLMIVAAPYCCGN